MIKQKKKLEIEINIFKMFNALLSTLDLFNNINANNCTMNKKNNDKNFARIDFRCNSNQIIPILKYYFLHSNCIFTIHGDHISYYYYFCSNFLTKNHPVYDLLIYIHNKISLYTIISRKNTNDNYEINKRNCLLFANLRILCASHCAII